MLAVVVAFVVVGLDDGDPLDVIEGTVEPACETSHRGAQWLLISSPATEPANGRCLLAIRSALTRAGWQLQDADAVLRAESGSNSFAGVMMLKERVDVRTIDDAVISMVVVEILDCQRALISTDASAWSDGLSTELFRHSPCDSAGLPIISQ